MKKILPLLALQCFLVTSLYSQKHRFNAELDQFCKTAIKESRSIPADRKMVLNELASQLSKKKYVVFTCKTNSRRTLMLQVWAQTSFYYFGLYDKHSFSLGDTVTNVYPGVGNILAEAGFYCTNMVNDQPNRFVICINKDYPENILSSKKEVGTIDTSRGTVVNICSDEEPTGTAANKASINLPYRSPFLFENTSDEKKKYKELNHQIAVEMLYLGEKVKEIIEAENAAKY